MSAVPKEYIGTAFEEHANLSIGAFDYAVPTQEKPFEGFGLVFVLDTSVPESELAAVKQSILEVVAELKEKYPLTANIGLITYSRDVTIYDIGGTLRLTKDFAGEDLEDITADLIFPNYLVFDGSKAVTVEDAIVSLGENVTTSSLSSPSNGAKEAPRYVKNADEAKYDYMCDVKASYGVFCALLDAVESEYVEGDDSDLDSYGERPECAVGTAMTLASALLAVSGTKSMGSRAMFFIGNPCTVGPGTVADLDRRKSKIRMHTDIQTGNVPYLDSALDVFQIIVNIYIISLFHFISNFVAVLH